MRRPTTERGREKVPRSPQYSTFDTDDDLPSSLNSHRSSGGGSGSKGKGNSKLTAEKDTEYYYFDHRNDPDSRVQIPWWSIARAIIYLGVIIGFVFTIYEVIHTKRGLLNRFTSYGDSPSGTSGAVEADDG
jgi:hypothetical protein